VTGDVDDGATDCLFGTAASFGVSLTSVVFLLYACCGGSGGATGWHPLLEKLHYPPKFSLCASFK
jgi:hypothetical protein